MPPPGLNLEVIGDLLKNGNLTNSSCTQRNSKGENYWEGSGSLDSNKLDIEGLKAAHRIELLQNRK